MKKFLPLIILIAVLIAGAWFLTPNNSTAPNPEPTNQIKITASFYPLAYFAQEVGGEHVNVVNITPPGAEPHEFRPTPQDIVKIYESNLFLFNGGGIDTWASQLQEELTTSQVLAIEMLTQMDEQQLLEPAEGHGHEAEEHDEDEDEHEEAYDEHIWLDPMLAIQQVEVIRDALTQIDPDHAQSYANNADTLISELRALDILYAENLSQCATRVAITSHAAFSYVADAYDFTMIAITGASPHDEPSAGALAEITHEAEEHGVKHIFFETLVNPRLAETLADEIGAETLVFNPLEGLTPQQLENEETYFSIMEQNLENLKTGMMCQ